MAKSNSGARDPISPSRTVSCLSLLSVWKICSDIEYDGSISFLDQLSMRWLHLFLESEYGMEAVHDTPEVRKIPKYGDGVN